jgi:hypothetical protein
MVRDPQRAEGREGMRIVQVEMERLAEAAKFGHDLHHFLPARPDGALDVLDERGQLGTVRPQAADVPPLEFSAEDGPCLPDPDMSDVDACTHMVKVAQRPEQPDKNLRIDSGCVFDKKKGCLARITDSAGHIADCRKVVVEACRCFGLVVDHEAVNPFPEASHEIEDCPSAQFLEDIEIAVQVDDDRRIVKGLEAEQPFQILGRVGIVFGTETGIPESQACEPEKRVIAVYPLLEQRHDFGTSA